LFFLRFIWDGLNKDIVIRPVDLSAQEYGYQFYSRLRNLRQETWVNNEGLGNYDSVAQQDLGKIETMIRLNIGGADHPIFPICP